jgi:hypothetical protein
MPSPSVWYPQPEGVSRAKAVEAITNRRMTHLRAQAQTGRLLDVAFSGLSVARPKLLSGI